MKKLIATLAAVSALLTSAPAVAAPANTVFHYDALRQAARGVSITQAVLDGSIYPEIDRVHPLFSGTGAVVDRDLLTAQRELSEARRKRNREAVQEHCKRERRASKASDEVKCGAGLSRRTK